MGAGRMGADWFWHIHGTWFGESQRGVGRGGSGIGHRARRWVSSGFSSVYLKLVYGNPKHFSHHFLFPRALNGLGFC